MIDDTQLDKASFSYKDLTGEDRWETFTPSGTITVVGTPTYTGRFRIVGRMCFFQITLVATTSVATTAGTSFFNLPVTAAGLGGMATMSNETTNVAVGTCHVDVTLSRVYPPTQGASANTFVIVGYYEV